MALMKLTRRKFLIAGGLVGGGLAVGFGLGDDGPENAALQATTSSGEFALNAWIKINKSGEITFAIPQAEMGQGVYTSLSMLLAEELEVELSSVTPEMAPLAPVYVNSTALMDTLPFSDGHHQGEATIGAWGMKKIAGMLGVQATGGSTSVRNAWEPMQKAGAIAREMLVSAAAEEWNVSSSECVASKGTVTHKSSGKTASYGELVEAASALEIPDDIPLKPANARKIIGKSQPRIDIPEKVDGSAVYGVDIDLPNMAHAAVKLCPVFGGTVASWDDKAILNMPGVIKAVRFDTGVAVIADSFWRAKKAVEALPVTFDEGPNAALSSEAIFAEFEQQLASDEGRSYADRGEALEKISQADTVISATYKVPFLAHACMEPMNCTALVSDNDVEVWMPNQAQTLIAWFAEKAADVPAENVKLHTPYLGGGFGRRLEIDLVVMAVTIAKELKGRPVKLIWTRENDVQHDMYRPAAQASFKGTLTSSGEIDAWNHRVASPSVTRSFTKRMLPWADSDMPDNSTADGAGNIPYQISNMLMEHVPTPLEIPVGYWRSVGHSYNAFFTEGFMDEMAWAAKKDPLEFRLDHVSEHTDFTAVLQKLKEVSDWSTPLPEGRGRGIALHESFKSIVGQVVEISVNKDKEISIDKVFCVIDCGTVVNPDTVKAQMESGIIFGLSAALFGEITIEKGRVVQENFPDYDMVRLNNCPEIEVHLAPSGRPLGGVGEPSTPPIAPAVVNAIFAATKTRIRELPLSKHGYTA
ncbi:MAG: xanthine dehydrogenase family protein molybdopterin-binding subunit [Sneathiella sp.]|nr:xanthine dehydrogenase family protein molybdopterin-binding subunit [Sneathiella sp.]